MNRSTRQFAAAFLAALLGAPLAHAETPATRPIDDPRQRIAALIADHAADDFKARDAASPELRKLGREALPALREALKSDDPSIKSYAEGLVAAINEDLSPPKRRGTRDEVALDRLGGLRPPGIIRRGAVVQLNAARHTAVNVRIVNGVKDVTVTEDGRKITIHEDPAGDIEVTVTEPKDGKEQTSRYNAKNAEELKKNHPEAHKLYEQYAAANGVRVIERGVRAELPAVIRPDLQRLREEHRARMDEVMRRARVPDFERLRVFEDLQEATRIQRQMMDEVRRELDKVREEMRREIIPDLRGLLPPLEDQDFEELEAPDDD